MPSTPSHQSSSIAVGLATKNKAARQKIRKGRNRAVIRKAFREKYPCGAISPNNVITTAEKKNAPANASEHWIGIFPQVKDARRILVPAVSLDLQTQLAEAKDRQIQAGKQRGQRDAGDNAKPNPDTWDVRHGTFSR